MKYLETCLTKDAHADDARVKNAPPVVRDQGTGL